MDKAKVNRNLRFPLESWDPGILEPLNVGRVVKAPY